MEIKKILFPTDFGVGVDEAAPYVADLAKRYGAKVYVMHVLYDLTSDAWGYGTHFDTEAMYSEMKAGAHTELEALVDKYFSALDTETILELGTPFEDIIWFADEKKVDLIVIGSHGRKGLGRVLFGSTAMRVVKNAHCPVLTVRAHAAGRQKGMA
ncbi:MAG: universal stress protein [Thermodesulfovibrionales bacterium]|nr:universal stress protein [Thermodesulfovibrionales bacterium]